MKNFKLILIPILFSVIFFAVPHLARRAESAAEAVPDKIEIVKAQVLSTENKGMQNLTGLDVSSPNQTITAQILEGESRGKTVVFDNDYIQLKKGDIFYLNDSSYVDSGQEVFSVEVSYRLPVLYFFILLFILLVIFIGGVQGVRGLLSLIGSFALIIYVLLPAILHGYSPVFVSIVVSSLIVILGSFITHGFNKTTSSAVLGMILTIIATGAMAYFAVYFSKFSGYSSEEAVFLNLNARGHIDIIGVLIGGIMIGLLGVLYDVAIGQAISVEEVHHIAPHISKKKIFQRSMRIGREHIGALVNTLAIAYVGASLPLLLLFSTPPVNITMTLNREIFAAEIIRILIGSIGLVLAVPITTLLATIMLVKTQKLEDVSVLKKENEAIAHYEHHH